jgi:hypothetical protein
MSTLISQAPRAALRGLLRGTVPAIPLFVPLLHAVAASVEALELRDILFNPTKLTKGLQGLRQAITTDALFCASPSGMEAEALGAHLNWDRYPPRVTKPLALDTDLPESVLTDVLTSPRVVATIETTRRLALTEKTGVLLAAALTGPATLADELGGHRFATGFSAGSEVSLPTLGLASRAVLLVARALLEAGVNLLLLVENVLPVQSAATAPWAAALSPIINVARFHRALPVVVLPPYRQPSDLEDCIATLPAGTMLCVTTDALALRRPTGPIAVALPPDPAQWAIPAFASSLVTTSAEISPQSNIPALRQACEAMRAGLIHIKASER